MQIEVAVLADCANIAAGDKLNVMGVFNRIFSPQFPAVHPFMTLVLRLRCDFDDGGRVHDLEIVMNDEDAGEFFKAAAKVQVPPIKPGGTGVINQILNFAGMSFAKPGAYFYNIRWDGAVAATAVLTLELAAPPRQP